MKTCYFNITGPYYRKWDYDEELTDDEELFQTTSTVTMTRTSEILLLSDNEKSRLLENFLKKHFFRELVEVICSFFVMCQ